MWQTDVKYFQNEPTTYDIELSKFSYTAGGSINWCNHLENSLAASFEAGHMHTLWGILPLLGIYPSLKCVCMCTKRYVQEYW